MIQQESNGKLTPRQRVNMALQHQEPDRVPVDFLATPEVWHKVIEHVNPDIEGVGPSEFVEPVREAIMRHFEVDCRLLSYDMFCDPPEKALHEGAKVHWWSTTNRSTPNRMWRQITPDGTIDDIWGTHSRRVENPYFGAYEGFREFPLSDATSVDELKHHPWPQPEWWDFTPMPGIMQEFDKYDEYHIRFRIGSVFEIAWQLRGLEEILLDFGQDPSIPLYIMDRLTEIYVENTRRVLEVAGDRLDMVYFYDDVATKDSLMISPRMWDKYIRPRHAQLVEVAHAHGKPVMYHCDGSIYPLIPQLIDLGIDVLNPIQPDAKNMDPDRLKAEFGDKMAFHGGVDIITTLPSGTEEDVVSEVRERVDVLGEDGGYIMCSSHHMQPDTPLENVLAMYQTELRYRNGN